MTNIDKDIIEDIISENLNLSDNDTEEQRFSITDDVKAEWALAKISNIKKEYERYVNTCNQMIETYQSKIDSASEKLERDTGYLQRLLYEYFLTKSDDEVKITKTQRTYNLPSGKLKLKISSPEIKMVNEKSLLAFLKDNDYVAYIKNEESPKWGEFKRNIIVTENNVCIDNMGLVIDGVEIIERPSVFNVEV